MISQSIALYWSWQETDSMNLSGYLRIVECIKVKDLFNQKDYCSFLWLVTTKFHYFYEIKRKKHKKLFFELGSESEVEEVWLAGVEE